MSHLYFKIQAQSGFNCHYKKTSLCLYGIICLATINVLRFLPLRHREQSTAHGIQGFDKYTLDLKWLFIQNFTAYSSNLIV